MISLTTTLPEFTVIPEPVSSTVPLLIVTPLALLILPVNKSNKLGGFGDAGDGASTSKLSRCPG
ncbi:hypothetical protein NIES73_48820 [Sphaerospermopsis kisseleviana NIES-73]|nr:hypothetical protein NIES73_48820 [Sphaerospermopsis kisseleviana NIES-73]